MRSAIGSNLRGAGTSVPLVDPPTIECRLENPMIFQPAILFIRSGRSSRRLRSGGGADLPDAAGPVRLESSGDAVGRRRPFYAVLPAGGCPRGRAERAIPESRALVLYAAIGDRYFLRGEKGDFLGNSGEFPYHCRSKIRKCGFFRGIHVREIFLVGGGARRSPGWISGRSSRNVSST